MGQLDKKLGIVELTFFGIGAIVGTGIFVIPAIAARIADVASFWVWLELGLLTIFMALCFAELASVHPDAGGPYKFVRSAFGEYFGFLTGWLAWLVSWLTIASLAAAVPYYLRYFIDLSPFGMILISILVLASITLLNYRGMHWGIAAQYFFTTVSILILWFFITWGIYFVKPEYYAATSHFVTLPALLFATVIIIEPFLGWETITYFAEDAKNPTRDIPRAIIYSSILVTLFYSAVIFVTMGVLKVEHLSQEFYPIAAAAEVFLGPIGAGIVAAGAILVLLGCLNSWIVSTARLPYALSRDGLFPKIFSRIHKGTATPHMALLLQFTAAAVAVTVAGFESIIYVLVSLAMLMYLLVFLSIPLNRKKLKGKIPFKLPGGVLIPLIASMIAIFVLAQLELVYLGLLGLLLLIGSFVYLYTIISRRNK